jgi:hypothetical protein
MKKKTNESFAIVMVLLFGVWGSLYTSKKGFWELFSLNIFAHVLVLITGIFLFIIGIPNIYFLLLYSKTIMIFLNLSWVLPVAKAKNSNETELSTNEIISIGKKNIDEAIKFLALINEYFVIMIISLFASFSMYAILTFFNFLPENFRIFCLILTFIVVAIFLIYDKATNTKNTKIL